MATVGHQIPGGVFVNETGTRSVQIPGSVFINETVSTALTITGILGTADAAGFGANVDCQNTFTTILGTATASGFTATVDKFLQVNGILGMATADGFAADIITGGGYTVDCSLGTATASGFTANVDRQYSITGIIGTATADGFTASVNAHTDVTGILGTATASGFTASLSFPSTATVARPMTDITVGGWLPNIGSTLYGVLDEVVADDLDYIYTNTPSTCKMALNPVVDPLTSAGQVVSYRAWSPISSGITVNLKQGVTTIASWTHATLPTVATTFQQALTAPQCDAITDYSSLAIEMTSL